MDNLSWEEKYEFLKVICPRASINMRAPGNWYFNSDMGVGNGSVVSGSYGNGISPQTAVENHFNIYSQITFERFMSNPKDKREYIRVYGEKEDRYFFYSKYGWKEISRKELLNWYE